VRGGINPGIFSDLFFLCGKVPINRTVLGPGEL